MNTYFEWYEYIFHKFTADEDLALSSENVGEAEESVELPLLK